MPQGLKRVLKKSPHGEKTYLGGWSRIANA